MILLNRDARILLYKEQNMTKTVKRLKKLFIPTNYSFNKWIQLFCSNETKIRKKIKNKYKMSILRKGNIFL